MWTFQFFILFGRLVSSCILFACIMNISFLWCIHWVCKWINVKKNKCLRQRIFVCVWVCVCVCILIYVFDLFFIFYCIAVFLYTTHINIFVCISYLSYCATHKKRPQIRVWVHFFLHFYLTIHSIEKKEISSQSTPFLIMITNVSYFVSLFFASLPSISQWDFIHL